MSAPLIPQEIYLLERYSSPNYFGDMRDHFAAMLKAAQDALDEFMKHIPPDYRNRDISQQPDVVWGERVLPNLQWVLDGLNKGYIRISHGDLEALGQASNVGSAFAAINRDYTWDWMPPSHFDIADAENSEAWERASNVHHTSLAQWCKGDLSVQYRDDCRGPLNAPSSWPQYHLNPQVQVKTDDKVPCNGIYLPDVADSCAQLLIKDYSAWGATVLRDPSDPNNQSFDRTPTIWTLVERSADSGGGEILGRHGPDAIGIRLRCEAGHRCTSEGWWFTPALPASRRRFSAGDIMPVVNPGYGINIWQWDSNQD